MRGAPGSMAGATGVTWSAKTSQSLPLVAGKRLHGVIQSVSEDRPVGVISCEEAQRAFRRDVLVHKRDLANAGAEVGSGVSFCVELNSEGKPQARNVMVEPLWDGEDSRAGLQADSKVLYLGFIKSFNPKSGFGFIACTEARRNYGSDVFLHRDELGGFSIGDAVRFRIVPDPVHGTPRGFDLAAGDGAGTPEAWISPWLLEQQMLEQKQEEEQLSQLQAQVAQVLQHEAENAAAEHQAAAQQEALVQQQQLEQQQQLVLLQHQEQQMQLQQLQLQQEQLSRQQEQLMQQQQYQQQQQIQQQQQQLQQQQQEEQLALLQQHAMLQQMQANAMTPGNAPQSNNAQNDSLQAYAAQLQMQKAFPDFDFNKTYVGVIRSFNESKGFGFISCDEVRELLGCDVFLHSSQRLSGEDVGDVVSFNVQPSRTGQPRAKNIQAIGSVQDPDVECDPSRVFQGLVKSYNMEKGFGFISCPETLAIYNADVFLHKHHAEGIEVGDTVNFTIKMNLKGQPQARNCTKVSSGGQVLSELQQKGAGPKGDPASAGKSRPMGAMAPSGMGPPGAQGSEPVAALPPGLVGQTSRPKSMPGRVSGSPGLVAWTKDDHYEAMEGYHKAWGKGPAMANGSGARLSGGGGGDAMPRPGRRLGSRLLGVMR